MDSVDSAEGVGRGHVFIRHHSSQYAAASQVKAALAQAGIAGWLAPDDISPGSAFDTQIIDAMRGARAIVLLLSPEADQSRHVKRELMLADDESIPVLPVRLEPLKAEGLAYFLKDKQWIDWFDGGAAGLDRLVNAVRGTADAPPSPLAVPVPRARPVRNTRRLAIVGAAVALLVVGGAAWYFATREVQPEPVVRPGLWLNKREMLALLYPEKVAEAETRQIKQMVETDPNPEECIPEEVARRPDVRLFDPGNKGKCALTGFQYGNGRMSGFLLCPIQGAKDATMSIVFQATYDKNAIVMESDVTIAQPNGSLRFKARDSSHWIADKCSAQNR